MTAKREFAFADKERTDPVEERFEQHEDTDAEGQPYRWWVCRDCQVIDTDLRRVKEACMCGDSE